MNKQKEYTIIELNKEALEGRRWGYNKALEDVENKHIKFEELMKRLMLIDKKKVIRVIAVLKEFRVMKAKIKEMKE